MSFSIATSGLNAISEQLNAISNNIANSGTVGFKSGRAEFASLYADGQALGVGVTAVAQSISRSGSLGATGNALDLAINGNGFFMVRDGNGIPAYTRAGYFGTDDAGNLVNNLGMYLQGYPIDANGNLQPGTVSNLTISNDALPAKASDAIDFTANLNANAKVPETALFDPEDSSSFNDTYTTTIYDSLGREHTLSQYFVKKDDNTWQVHYVMDGELQTGSSQTLAFSTQGVLSSPTDLVAFSFPVTGADDLTFTMNYKGSTQYGSDFSVSKNNCNGYASGQRTGQAIDADGRVFATFSNGERKLQGQLVLASFTSPQGLSSEDGTCWRATLKSGDALLGAPGVGILGGVKSGFLEASNVDMTSELVTLMSAQRNYQANTKVISTNDNMMNALFQAV
ncbi:flagellar hook protein FlgE [Pluralibacter gergoviae]|uniref:flagellar hook protein FlgE n=1 Tax=Pluralibacter gergoviae TaxID=61647 RepID=UPI0005EC60B8|nr:flagellar hook protein FlgE [Pluralibacter gergoviae]KJM59194.1 flagellar hook protein FlgE [Pluralibacter gergoviae]KMK19921.1 flagellar hook protein FlgE [Pluralibacter gergoviae]OUQ99712.1 flagellar hook protein FlgE [Pluralibacter gergoviae]